MHRQLGILSDGQYHGTLHQFREAGRIHLDGIVAGWQVQQHIFTISVRLRGALQVLCSQPRRHLGIGNDRSVWVLNYPVQIGRSDVLGMGYEV